MVPLADIGLTDTRALFRPVSRELVTLLRALEPAQWDAPTVAGRWLVRDVVAHLTDGALRRLSFDRDRVTPPDPGPIASERDFVAFINNLNEQWILVARRLSPRVLTDLFEVASTGTADWFESMALDAPALFPVSWAGEAASPGWFDVGREFTELWHHQEQVRMAVSAPSLTDPRYLQAVIEIAVRGLPHAFRGLRAEPGASVTIDVTGPSGGRWTLTHGPDAWQLAAGMPDVPTTRLTLRDDVAWKLLFNALPQAEAVAALRIEGNRELAAPLLRARSVIV
jgi:uncharacterized protein (TIGR03083 family)